jgi:cation transport ATPase
MLTATAKRGPIVPTAYVVTSAFPGRIRVKLINIRGRYERVHRLADWLLGAESFLHISIKPDAGSLIVHFDNRHSTLENALAQVKWAAANSDSIKPPKGHRNGHHLPTSRPIAQPADNRHVHHVTAKDLHASASPNLQTMVIPTIAFLLASIEAVPVAIVVVAIALSTAPTARRAYNDIKSRRVSVDELDLLNVTLAVVDGAMIPAAAISWLTNLGEWLRVRAMAKTRDRNVAVHAAPFETWELQQGTSTKLMLENALLTNTQFQGVTAKFHLGATAPFVGAAGLISFATQDLGFIVGVLKPLYDFSSAIRFGVPAVLLNTMSQTAKHGPIFHSGRAVENLAKIDAIVFFTTSGFRSNKVLQKRIKQLAKRGINHFFMPTVEEAALVEAVAASIGKNYVAAEVIPPDPAHAVGILHRHGHTVAIVDDGSQEEHWLHRADVRIGLPRPGSSGGSADIIMSHSDMRGIGHCIDQARHGMEVAHQNIVVSAISAAINLSIAILPPLAATTVSTITTGILSANIIRELNHIQEEEIEGDHTDLESLDVIYDATP